MKPRKMSSLIANLKKYAKFFGLRGKTLAITPSSDDETAEDIISNFKEFGELEASDIMINRKDIVSAHINTSFNQLVKLFIDEGHSRVPIYKSSLDEIEGFIHMKDVFKISASKNSAKVKCTDLMRDIIFVPESIKLQELLSKMKKNQIHIAIVLDEHAGTAGLLTIEDIVEELVGDINDEHDSKCQQHLIHQDAGSFIVDASAKVEEVEQYMDVKFIESIEDADYDTIGGLVITHLSCIPQTGYKFIYDTRFEIEVLDATFRRVKQLKITVL